MASPIKWKALAVVLLGASVCHGGEPSPFRAADRDSLLRRLILPGRALRLQAEGLAGLIVLAGRVWTGDPANPWAEGVAARDGAIVKVGSREDVLRFKHPRTIVIDRPGSFAMPGLIDAHGHVEWLGSSLEQVDLRGVSSLDEVARRVKARIESVPGDSWITGGSWDQSLWPGGAFPTAAVLDAVAPGRPVWLRRVDLHAGWANSQAMRQAGVGRQTMAPADGQVLRDPDGQPTGIFVDGAMGLVARVVPPSKPDDLKRRILAAQQQILAAGLTGVHDAGIPPAVAQVYRDLDRSGQLRLRVYAMSTLPSGHEVEFVSRPPRKASPADRFELRAVKVFIDGAMGSRGALLFQPYHDDPASKGLLLIDPKVLEATTVAALRNRWQVATHAIGDRGNALVLDAYSARPEGCAGGARCPAPGGARPGRPQGGRAAVRGVGDHRLDAAVTRQRRHALGRCSPRRGRVDGAYAWRWFLDAQVPLAFGSDFPVEIVNPFWGIYAAITRQDAEGKPPGGWHPEQCLSLEETLRGFTAGAAYAAFAEDRSGILRVGMQADLTLVDRDLFRASPRELLESRVVMTIIAGQVAFENPGS